MDRNGKWVKDDRIDEKGYEWNEMNGIRKRDYKYKNELLIMNMIIWA